MKYRKLDKNGDSCFGHGVDDYHIDSAEAVTQSVLTRLRLWRGEWYIDKLEGTPYLQEVLGKNTEASSVVALKRRILETEGVLRVLSISAQQDPDTRKATFEIVIDTKFGEVSIHG